MITLYYSPMTRATSVLGLLRMMGREQDVTIKLVGVQRSDGSGGADPANPHPEGKVPILDTGRGLVRERGAIMLWLTDHFGGPLARGPEHEGRGEFLSWLFYYSAVMEPVLYMEMLGQAENPLVQAWCRDSAAVTAALSAALKDRDYLVDDAISAADLLAMSHFAWLPDAIPDDAKVRAWIERCMAAQDMAWLEAYEAEAIKALG